MRRRSLDIEALRRAGDVREDDAARFLVGREIHDGEAVEVRQLHEHPRGRSVRILLERDRTNAPLELHRPRHPFRRLVDDRQRASGNRTGDDELAVRRHVHVVDAAFGADALHARQRAGVDDVDRAGAGDDGGVDALAVLADPDVVRMVRQRNVLGDFQRLQVRHVERRLRLVGDVEARAVRRCRGAVVDLDVLDLADHLVRRRINQHHAVARRVGLDDPDGGGLQGKRHQNGERERERKFGVHSVTL